MRAHRFGSLGWAALVAVVAFASLTAGRAARADRGPAPADRRRSVDARHRRTAQGPRVGGGQGPGQPVEPGVPARRLDAGHRASRSVARDPRWRAGPDARCGRSGRKAQRLSGLMDVALHPRFAENRFIYLTFSKPREDGMLATALARASLRRPRAERGEGDLRRRAGGDGAGGSASRIVFGRDGLARHADGPRREKWRRRARTPRSTRARSCACATTARCPRQPVRGQAGFKPEIYSYGHRNSLGLIVHPVTGALWNIENGPNGGDEINIVHAGRNYGWPTVSMGRSYDGPWQGKFAQEGMEAPLVYWMPSIAASACWFTAATGFRHGKATPSGRNACRRDSQHRPHAARGVQREGRGDPA